MTDFFPDLPTPEVMDELMDLLASKEWENGDDMEPIPLWFAVNGDE